MGDLMWYDYLRLFNSLLALMCIYKTSRRLNFNWSIYTKRLRELNWTLMVLFIGLIDQNLKAIIYHHPFDSETVVSLLVCLFCIRAQFRNEGYIEGEDPPLKS